MSYCGNFVNTGARSFEMTVRSDNYVDKTSLLAFTNSRLNTDKRFICVSRPRRFGKTITANMLAAYYSCGSSSTDIFDKLAIANDASYKDNLNKYSLIRIDMQQYCDKSISDAVDTLQRDIVGELNEAYPEVQLEGTDLAAAVMTIGKLLDKQFVIIIDEWDLFLRDKNYSAEEQGVYINLLRKLFKSEITNQYIALAYITGILPIIRYSTESALNNFTEYTMLRPDAFADHIGFTENEVRSLCDKHNISYDEVSRWYDGYLLNNSHIFNPHSIICMIESGFGSYWTRTVAFDSLLNYINYNFDGLRDGIITMMGGTGCPVKVSKFTNNVHEIKNKDDALTLLIHYGYLAYDPSSETAYIPNEEIRSVFFDTVQETKWSIVPVLERSDRLLEATLEGNAELVAEYLEKAHEEYSDVLTYNRENDLSCVIRLAYYTASKYYTILRELPSGKGFADMVFLPNSGVTKPALVVELKWNISADTAITQIKEKNYPSALEAVSGDILLVGISYDKETKAHSCVIEKYSL
ncbi:MAG: AAA family ATPase [Oscillospiraceae bacterium]|nr:AAA family ATPase [Oscillospiraceae bacterium]